MTIILGDNSLIHKKKKPDMNPRSREGSLRRRAPLRGCNRMATALGTLGLGLVICFFMLCLVGFCFLYEWFTLFQSFSMHLYILPYMVYWIWIRSCCILSCMTFIFTIFLRAHTLNFKLSWGLAACLMT